MAGNDHNPNDELQSPEVANTLSATEVIEREKAAFQLLLDEVRKGAEDAAWTLVERYGPHIR
ncbi:MAG: hypothetical protein ACI9G1_002877, partial [Pirellulaceae bacterium]